MTQHQPHQAESPPSNPPRWWRLHASTYLVLIGLAAVLALANVPGQIVVAPDPFARGGLPVLASCRSCEHGWPVAYLWREEVAVGNVTRLSPWSLSEGVLRFSYLGLGLDLLAAAAVLLLGVALYEAWRRRRSKVYQFHVRDLLILATVLSAAFAWLAWQAKQYREEQEVLRQLELTTTYCQWQPGGPSWIREWIGADRFRIFDRVLSIEIGHKQQFARWMRAAESDGVFSGTDSPNDLVLPLIEGTDPVIPGLGDALRADNLPRYRVPPQPEASQSQAAAALDDDLACLRRLARLRGLVLSQTGITDKQMAHLASLTGLQSLDLSEWQIGDEGLAHLAGLTKLEQLSLSSNGITDDGLVHLEGLHNLRNLTLNTRATTSAALVHLRDLTNLERLDVSVTGTTDAGLQHLTRLTKLKDLQLWRLKATDAELAHLAQLTALENLNLDFSEVTDAGLEHLSRLVNLPRLHLRNARVTGPGLAHLKGLTNLRHLDLSATLLTDAGLAHLKGPANLEWLWLSDTQITDTGLIHLQTLSKLEALSLDNTQVTDAGLVHLESLPNLRMVFLRNTKATKQGVGKLRKVLRSKALRKWSVVEGP